MEIFANQSAEGAGTLIPYSLYGFAKYLFMVFPFPGHQVSHQQECGVLL